MILSRRLTESDIPLLQKSLAQDGTHCDTTSDFFFDPRCVSNVYADDAGPVLVARGSKALRIDIQFLDNQDVRRNARVMAEGFESLAEQARASGFSELIFNTTNPLLRRFCVRRFGFEESQNELRRYL